MGNENRYGKLELEKGDNFSGKKRSGFKRKLEIFGLPSQKRGKESKTRELCLDDDLTPPPEGNTPTVKSSGRRVASRKRQNFKKRKRFQKRFKDLQVQADKIELEESPVPRYSKYDEKLKKNRSLPEYRKREILRRGEMMIRRERARKRVRAARSNIMWVALLVIGLIVLLSTTSGPGRGYIIEIGLTVLLAFLGIRGRYRRW